MESKAARSSHETARAMKHSSGDLPADAAEAPSGPSGGDRPSRRSATPSAAKEAETALQANYSRRMPHARYIPSAEKWEAYLPADFAFARQRGVLTAEYVDAWREDMLELEDMNNELQDTLRSQRKSHKATQDTLTACQEELSGARRALLASQDEARELRLQLQREQQARAADEEERRQHLEDRARRIGALTDELNAANARAALSQQEASDLRGELATATAQVKELEREVSKLSRLHDCMHSDRSAAVLEQRTLTEEARREVERLKGQASSSADLARRVTELQTLLTAAQEEVRAEMRRGTAGAEEVGAARAAKAAAERHADELGGQLADATAERQELKCDIARMQQEAHCESKRTQQKLALGKLMLKLAHRKASQLEGALADSQAQAERDLAAAQANALAAATKAELRARVLFKALRFTALRTKLSSAATGIREAFDRWRLHSMQWHTVRRTEVLPLLLQRKQRNAAWKRLCVSLVTVVQNRQQQKALFRAWLQWRRIMWGAAQPAAAAPARRAATPPSEPQDTSHEVHHFHHFEDAPDLDDPKKQPVLCYGAVASDLPARSFSRPVQRPAQHARSQQQSGQSSHAQARHVFYPTDEKPQAAVRRPVSAAARAAAVRKTARASNGNSRRASTSGSRHCRACEQLASGHASSEQHSMRHGHCQAAADVQRDTAATKARQQATQEQLQQMQRETNLQLRREHALADVAEPQRARARARFAVDTPAATRAFDEHDDVSNLELVSDDEEHTYEAASEVAGRDFRSGAAESALSRSPQRVTATEAMAATLQFTRGTSAKAAAADTQPVQLQKRGQVHWDNSPASASRPAEVQAAPPLGAPAEHATAKRGQTHGTAQQPKATSREKQAHTAAGYVVAARATPATFKVEGNSKPQEQAEEDALAEEQQPPHEEQSGEDDELNFEMSMARIGRSYFESCAPLQVSSVHQIARLGGTEALLGVLSLADYLALGGQVGEARLSIPAPRDVGASAQADMFSLGVLQECLMGRSPGARAVWSTASAALLHGAATATGRAAPDSSRGAENILAGLGGVGLLKSTSAWNSMRSQVAILISRCEEYCLQGHLRRKWAIMWDALYQRLLMFVAWNVARSVEGFLFVASAPLQPGAGRPGPRTPRAAQAGVRSSSGAYGWDHGRTRTPGSQRSSAAVAAAAAAASRLAPPAWLQVGATAVPQAAQGGAGYDRADSVMTTGSRGASTTADVLGSTAGSAASGTGDDAAPAPPATVPCLDPPVGNVLGGAMNGEAPSGSQRASLLYGRLASFVVCNSHGSSGDALRLLMVMQQLKTTFKRKARQVDAVHAALGPEAAEQFLQGPFTGMPAGVHFDAAEADASACCPSAADVRFILGEVVSLWQPQAEHHHSDPADSHKLDHLLLLQPAAGARRDRSALDTPGPVDGPTLQPVRFWQLVTHPVPCIQAVLDQSGASGAAASRGRGRTAGAVASPSLPEEEAQRQSVRHLLQQVHEASATARPWRDVKMSALTAVLPPLRTAVGADAEADTDAGHAGPLQSALEAASANRHARQLPNKNKNDTQSGQMLSDFSDLLTHLLDCMLLARAASTALTSAVGVRGGTGRPSAVSPGFSEDASSSGGLNLAAGGQQRLVFDLHVAESILHLSLYVEFAAWFSTQQ